MTTRMDGAVSNSPGGLEVGRRVPLLDLKRQMAPIRAEIQRAIDDVLDSTMFVGGPVVSQFEGEFARYCGTRFSAAVNSGTDALRFALLASGIGPGDEVITVPNTFIATLEAISQTGADPVLVDVDPETYTLDVSHVEKRITKRTKAVVPVHLYGQPADMDPLLELGNRFGIPVVEDACQAHGAEYKGRRIGSLGTVGCFSFYPGKNLGAYGEGGAITTNDEQLYQRVRMLRDHGQKEKYVHEIEGYNGRLDALQCAILRVKLRYLDSWNEKRRQKAHLYTELLSDCRELVVPSEKRDRKHVYHLYVVRLNHRDSVAGRLKQLSVDTGLHYPIPLHHQKAYANKPFAFESFPVTEACAATALSLPIFPEMEDAEVRYVVEAVRRSLKNP